MAIYHLSMKLISRGSGRSAVAASAYRSGTKLTNERDGLTHDFTRKQGIEHSEILLPDGSNAEWARDRSALWNAAEFAENRKDARVAREFEIALPHELTAEQRLELTRSFSQDLANQYNAAIDFAVHTPNGETDIRNHHAHVMMTTRSVEVDGLGDKTDIERENKWLLNRDRPTSHMQLRYIRQSWEERTNEHLARAGLDLRIDHRSHQERGLEIEPTQHVGVHATQMERRGMDVSRSRLEEDAAKRNAELIREQPEQVLTVITDEKSVFDRLDVARTLHRYIDDVDGFRNAFAQVMGSPALVELQAEREAGAELARYSTREMIDIEMGMSVAAERMSDSQSHMAHRVKHDHVERAIDRQNAAIQKGVAAGLSDQVRHGELTPEERDKQIAVAGLSDEQRGAIRHVTGPEQIAVVVGYAGAGKSTMLAAAREAWEAQGCRVLGAALSGKAAEGLEETSGIQSRTLASFEYGWKNSRSGNRSRLGKGDVLVIDEAGMVGSKQLSRFIGEAERRGAKIVLVGDHEQLQSIGAGAPFRTIAEQVGHAELSEVRRQNVDWQRKASVAFATHRTADALAAYEQHGAVHLSDTRENACHEIVYDYLADREQRPQGSRVALAHRRVDVREINAEIRSVLQERGELAQGEDAGEFSFQTNDGKRSFAAGDRVVFLENNRDLDVKNGMLGTVEAVEPGRITASLDGRGRSVSVSVADYAAIDHGYATTIHKSQGATVDRAFVMASSTMDRHLTYVSMTRHRDDVQLYASQDEFSDRGAGSLVDHGKAPYEHSPDGRDSYYVSLKGADGKTRTIWGVDLERAMKEAAPQLGDKIGLDHDGSQTVRLPNGGTAERNSWNVLGAKELASKRLKDRLSRSGAKESTLDYKQEFAAQRGIADSLGIQSEIKVERSVQPAGLKAEDLTQSPGLSKKHIGDLARARRAEDLNRIDSREQIRPAMEKPARRGMFDGLKLTPPSKEHHEPAQQWAQDNDRLRRPSALEKSVDRYARAYTEADQMLRDGLPVLEGQKNELRGARQELDKIQPDAGKVLRSALEHDPQTYSAATELDGRARTSQFVKGMEKERRLLADPNVRAERAINQWQLLDSELKTHRGPLHREARERIEEGMRTIAATMEYDPQMQKIVRDRAEELGINHIKQGQNITAAMEQKIIRSRDIGIER